VVLRATAGRISARWVDRTTAGCGTHRLTHMENGVIELGAGVFLS
jgi:hypothetical protein